MNRKLQSVVNEMEEHTESSQIKSKKLNVMVQPVIRKVTFNIGVGEGGEKLEKAVTLLKRITDASIVKTKTMKRIPAFGVRPRLLVGAKVNVRGRKAEELLKKAFIAVGNKLKAANFDETGNFSFGIKDYGDLPGMKYDPHLGMFGMDVCVNLGRKGYRVKYRKVKASKVGAKHLLTKKEAMEFISKKFGVEIEEKVKPE